MTVVAGVDFGTASVRVAIVDSERGHLGMGTHPIATLRLPNNSQWATQRHEDHCEALETAFGIALANAGVKGASVAAVAVDTTGSTVIALDEDLLPLDDYMLWCDHRAYKEAEELTERAREQHLEALQWCGGRYSSEWGFAKVLYWLRHNPQRRARFFTAMEHCDYMVATLCGTRDWAEVSRSVCAMGHKWLWNAQFGGLPPEDYLGSVDPLLKGIRRQLPGRYRTSDQIAGALCEEWARRLGLRTGIPIPVGALDAHWDAIGAGCRIGDVVNVIGTSTCMMAVTDSTQLIPGVSGMVHGSIHPHKMGVESGLSAVGDLFEAIARRAGVYLGALSERIVQHRAGQTGLLRFAWDNGDRSVLVDPTLSGITLGWRLNSTPADELFAAIEGTAFHTRLILERMVEYGVDVQRIINAGGIPQRNPTLNRVYSAVLGKPILVPASDVTSLGSAAFAFVAAGCFRDIDEAQEALRPPYRVIEPNAKDVGTYDRLFEQFKELYFMFSQMGSLRSLSVPTS